MQGLQLLFILLNRQDNIVWADNKTRPPNTLTCDSFILQSVLRKVLSHFQSELPTECELALPLSISSILSFPLRSSSSCLRLLLRLSFIYTRVGTLIVATIYLQLIQNRYMFRSFTVLQGSHQHCLQPVASDVEVVGYL